MMMMMCEQQNFNPRTAKEANTGNILPHFAICQYSLHLSSAKRRRRTEVCCQNITKNDRCSWKGSGKGPDRRYFPSYEFMSGRAFGLKVILYIDWRKSSTYISMHYMFCFFFSQNVYCDFVWKFKFFGNAFSNTNVWHTKTIFLSYVFHIKVFFFFWRLKNYIFSKK